MCLLVADPYTKLLWCSDLLAILKFAAPLKYPLVEVIGMPTSKRRESQVNRSISLLELLLFTTKPTCRR